MIEVTVANKVSWYRDVVGEEIRIENERWWTANDIGQKYSYIVVMRLGQALVSLTPSVSEIEVAQRPRLSSHIGVSSAPQKRVMSFKTSCTRYTGPIYIPLVS